MFYLEITIQFILKMLWVWLPLIISTFILLATITYIRKDSKWLIKLINKVSNI